MAVKRDRFVRSPPEPPVDHPSATLALFDLDRTLLPGSSLVALGRALGAAGYVPRRRLTAAAIRDARFRRSGASDAKAERLRGDALAAVRGLDRAPLIDLAHSVGARLCASIAPGARLLLERHIAAGDFCVVLSASPQELVEAVCSTIGAHRAIGTRGEVVDGRYTGRLDGPFCYGPGKLVRLRQALGPVDLAGSWAYADSASDLPLLEAVGNPVVVNPDRALRAIALERAWPMLTPG